MKKLIILLTLLTIASCAYAANDEKREAILKMNESYKKHQNACQTIARNFYYDKKFSSYFTSRCFYYQSDRARMLDSMFPVVPDNEYMAKYPIIRADFVIKMNDIEMQNMKTIAEEYCKNASSKVTNRNPNACSNVKSLF